MQAVISHRVVSDYRGAIQQGIRSMSINLRTTHLFLAVVVVLGVAMVESVHSAVRAEADRPDLRDTQTKADGSLSVWDGIYTDEQARRGGPLYEQYCASCHGPDLSGGEMAPALGGSGSSANWDGLSVGDLFERMRASMPQNDPGKLSRQQNADVLAYILSRNKFPAGKTELGRETEVLNQIRYQALKPQ